MNSLRRRAWAVFSIAALCIVSTSFFALRAKAGTFIWALDNGGIMQTNEMRGPVVEFFARPGPEVPSKKIDNTLFMDRDSSGRPRSTARSANRYWENQSHDPDWELDLASHTTVQSRAWLQCSNDGWTGTPWNARKGTFQMAETRVTGCPGGTAVMVEGDYRSSADITLVFP